MSKPDYAEPLSQLLTFGDVRGKAKDNIDYLALGITTDHTPELARMSVDQDLMWADSESDEVWANVHAWRAIGQLRDPAGVPTLIEVLRNSEEWDDDWSSSESVLALAMIGEASIDPLRSLLEDVKLNQSTRGSVVEAYEAIAKEHQNLREDCVVILREQLANFNPHHYLFNASIISTLASLNAVEAAPEIEQAFAADAVDISIDGDWEEIQIRLGLLAERSTPLHPDGWYMAERERLIRLIEENSEKLAALRTVVKQKEERQLLDTQRNKRNQARKQAKQAKQKQRAKIKKKKRKKK